MPGPSLSIQVVVFQQPAATLLRLAESLANAARIAQAANLISSASLAIGDCGPVPALTAAHLEQIDGEAWTGLTYDHFAENLGHGGGHNRLSESSTEELLLVINPDTVAEPLMIARLAERFADPAVALAEARQLPVEHPKEYDKGGGSTPWASLACAMLRFEAFRQVGRFDADTFFLHGDDVDLSWRLRLAGWQVVHQASARVFHDKTVGVYGYIEPGAAELVHGPLGSLLLAYKYSRDDVLGQLKAQLAQGSEHHRRALELFEQRVASGSLPQPRLDPDRTVAGFVDGNFAKHRF